MIAHFAFSCIGGDGGARQSFASIAANID